MSSGLIHPSGRPTLLPRFLHCAPLPPSPPSLPALCLLTTHAAMKHSRFAVKGHFGGGTMASSWRRSDVGGTIALGWRSHEAHRAGPSARRPAALPRQSGRPHPHSSAPSPPQAATPRPELARRHNAAARTRALRGLASTSALGTAVRSCSSAAWFLRRAPRPRLLARASPSKAGAGHGHTGRATSGLRTAPAPTECAPKDRSARGGAGDGDSTWGQAGAHAVFSAEASVLSVIMK